MQFNLENYHNILSNTIFLTLCLTMILYWLSLILTKNIILVKCAKFGGGTCLTILFFYLSWRWYNYKFFPLSNLYESLLFLDCLLLIIYKYIEYKTKSKIIGSLIIPLTLLIQGFASLSLPIIMQKSSPLVPSLQSNWLMLHVSMMMLSYATLLFGSLLSIFYVIISNKLQSNKNNNINNNSLNTNPQKYSLQLKSTSLILNNEYKNITSESIIETKNLNRIKLLVNLDNWSYRTIGIGFPFLTVGIISGAVWANEAWGSYWSWDPKETWALITWLIFAIYLHVRITKNWTGKKTAIVGSIGFFVIWICYLGVNFLGKGLHSYGWLN